MKYILILATLVLLGSCVAPPSGVVPPLFSKKEVTNKNSLVAGSFDNAVVEVSQERQDSILAKKESALNLTLPYKDSLIVLVLKSVTLLDQGFKVGTDKGDAADIKPSLFYAGYVLGDDSSTVTLSINETDVTGLIYSHKLGMITIIRVRNSKFDYLIYRSLTTEPAMSFGCFTKDSVVRITKPKVKLKKGKIVAAETITPKCITMDYEMTYENYVYFQSNTQSVVNYITNLALAQRSIYLKEGLDVSVKYIYVWTTPDGYDANTGTALTQLGTKRANDPAFTGTFTQLIRGRTGGALSGIAWVGGLCNRNYRFSVAEPMFNWSAYPAYSWSVNVITHELGHNFGSPHTQSCSWPGGAIDNCYTTEGGCPPGPAPVNGGTIMSYCHMTGYGINFANGFGPLPHDLIFNNVTASVCPACTVTPVPTCSDGIKNGTETGIDCGGSCPPCPIIPPPTSCSDGIKNGTETGIDCGGTCPPCPVSGTNLALNKPSTLSSNYTGGGSYPASYGNDGNNNTFLHTDSEVNPWFQIDLGSSIALTSLNLINRVGCCGYRLHEFKIFVSNTPITNYSTPGHVYYYNGAPLANGANIVIPVNVTGRYIKLYVQNFQSGDFLNIAELGAYAGTVTPPPPPGPCVPVDTIYKVTRYKLTSYIADSVGKTKCN